MLRIFLRILSRSRHTPAPSSSPPRVLLYAHVDPVHEEPRHVAATDSVKGQAGALSAGHAAADRRGRTRSRVGHRAWLYSMRLEHTRLCSDARCELLRGVGVLTAGDLACCDPAKLAKNLGGAVKTTAVLARYRRAIRLAAAVPGMMPPDAMILIHIHRRSLRGLAIESPAGLYRDLQRFSLSTKGRRLMKGRQVPSVRRLKKWIAACDWVIKKANSGESKNAKPSRVVIPRLPSAA